MGPVTAGTLRAMVTVMPQALLLDLDGTLVDSEMVHVAGLVRLCQDRGVELGEDEGLFVIGHGWREIFQELRLGERLGLDLPGVIAGTVAAKERLFGEGLALPLLPGARELLALAREAAIPTAIVTGSARRELEQALALLGLERGQLVSVCAEDVAHGKPSPDGFLRAAGLLAVAPAGCLVIEDSEAGISAGLAAGMRVLAVAAGNRPPGSPGHQDQSQAHHRRASLAGLGVAELAGFMAR